MSDITPLVPRQPVPALAVPLAGGGAFDLHRESAQNFTLVVFYRGVHCPICERQLREVDSRLAEFAERGTSVVAISTDDRARGEKAHQEWGFAGLRLGYGLDLATARRWGLYGSSGRGRTSAGEEPALFIEPGLFLVRADRTLYFASVQTMPFARPHIADILAGIDLVLARNYPARGEVMAVPQDAA